MRDQLPMRITDALKQYEAADAALRQAIAEEYPIGSTVDLMLGGRNITGTVKGYSPKWCWGDFRVAITNDLTGKTREFHATDPSHDAICVWTSPAPPKA